MQKTEDPFTKVDPAKRYAPEEPDNQIDLEGLASSAESAIGEGVSQVQSFAAKRSKKASQRRADRAEQRRREKE